MHAQGDFVGLVCQERFHQLRFVEQFTLWSVRMWLRAYCRGSELFSTLHEAFDVLGISDARRSFDSGMAILAVGTHRELLFLGIDSQYISRDEMDFLKLLNAFQQGETDPALARMNVWLPVSGSRIAGAAVAEFARHLANRGLFIGIEGGVDSVADNHRGLAVPMARLH